MSSKKQISVGQYAVLTLAIGILLQGAGPSKKETPGEKIYMNRCEACHMHGINVIKPEKHIVSSSKLVTEEAFKQFLSEKHGLMPRFSDIADNDKDLANLYEYVKRLKYQSWDYVPPQAKPEEEVKMSPNLKPDQPQ